MACHHTLEQKASLLHHFAETELTPSEEYATQGRECANEIFNALRGGTNYIARVCISGSMGKKTALGDEFQPDFDLVVFCNKSPPWDDVLKTFKHSLVTRLQVALKRQNQFMLTIKYGGFEYDICPATNFAVNLPQGVPARTDQRNNFYSYVATSSDPEKVANFHSTAVAESVVDFMKSQDSFTHAVVRLAKYWNKKLPPMGYISGRSFLIEIVAVSAAKTCALGGEARMYYVFREFLRTIQKLGRTQIMFSHNYDLHQLPASWKQGSLILDPANPYNNLVKNLTPENIEDFRQAAQTTLGRLGALGAYEVKYVLDPEVSFRSIRHLRKRAKSGKL